MAKRDSAWDIGMHLGKKIGVPSSAKGIITGFGAGMTVTSLATKDDILLVIGLLTALIGVTA